MNKKIISVLIAVIVMVIIGVVVFSVSTGRQSLETGTVEVDLQNKESVKEEPVLKSDIKENGVSLFTREEVALHSAKNDCWLIIDNKVYDVTNFIALGNHPPQIEMGCGRDATSLFRSRTTEGGEKIGSGKPHSNQAENLRQKYYIGDLDLRQNP